MWNTIWNSYNIIENNEKVSLKIVIPQSVDKVYTLYYDCYLCPNNKILKYSTLWNYLFILRQSLYFYINNN